jgi:hypothetical protein
MSTCAILKGVEMDRIALGYERLLQRITAWSHEEPDVRAAVIIGSRARTDHPADE